MKAILLLLALFSFEVLAQPVSGIPLVAPGQKGTSLPATCTIGQLFFKTDATAGQNIYYCTSSNTWTQQTGGGGSGVVIDTTTVTGGTNGDFLYINAGTVGSVALPSLTGTPAAGDLSYWTGASAQALFHPTTTSLLLTNSASAPTAYAGSTVTSGQMPTAISAAGVLSGTATPTLGASGTLGSITFGNATSGTITIQPVTGALGTTTLTLPAAVGTGRVSQVIASGTSAMGTSAISSGACATVVTTSATGTATTDVINWGFNGDPTSTTGYAASANGMLTIIAYPSANNVNFKVCNNTSASVTPGATVTLNWIVVR